MSDLKNEALGKSAPVRTSGTRFAVALGSWCFAGVGVLVCIMFAGAGIAGDSLSASKVLAFIPIFAWVSLAVMTLRWLQDRRCHWAWPVLGTLAGTTSAIAFIGAFFFYLSAIPMAIYLVFWHTKPFLKSENVV